MSYNAELRLELLQQKATTQPHGTLARYNTGCRCAQCRDRKSAYKRERDVARICGDRRHLVKADRARAHIEALVAGGVKREYIVACSGVSIATICYIQNGQKTKLRAHTERKILSVHV